MFRAHFYNEGKWYYPTPVFRQMVVPGQSVEFDITAHMEAPAFTKRIMGGGQATLALFYVPFRLLWDQWVKFVAEDSYYTSTTVTVTPPPAFNTTGPNAFAPSTTTPWPLVFEPNLQASPVLAANVFGRRAYKLIYNQFYGDRNIGTNIAWFADITTDTEVPTYGKAARNLDQWVSTLVQSSDIRELNLQLAVQGTSPSQTVSIPMRDLRRVLNQSVSLRKQDMTGDKYVDAIGRMGVKLDWRVQQAPELLGLVKGSIENRVARSTQDAVYDAAGVKIKDSLGVKATEWSSDLRLRTSRRFFAEHGVVMGIVCYKPVIFNPQSKGAPDSTVTSRQNFYMGDNVVGTTLYDTSSLDPEAGVYQQNAFSYLFHGRNQMGNRSVGDSWCASDEVANVDQVIYVTDFSEHTVNTDKFNGSFAVLAEARNSLTLPFNPKTF